MNARRRPSLAQAAQVFAVFVIAAVAGGARPQPGSGRTHILFVGNSLTNANDLPHVIEALSRASGGQQVTCSVVAFPGYSLEDHWNRGDAVRAIERGGWTIVVLQQGPRRFPSRVSN